MCNGATTSAPGAAANATVPAAKPAAGATTAKTPAATTAATATNTTANSTNSTGKRKKRALAQEVDTSPQAEASMTVGLQVKEDDYDKPQSTGGKIKSQCQRVVSCSQTTF